MFFFFHGSYDQGMWWFKKNSRRWKNLSDLSSESSGGNTGAITLIIRVFFTASLVPVTRASHTFSLSESCLVVVDSTRQHNGSMQRHSELSLPPP